MKRARGTELASRSAARRVWDDPYLRHRIIQANVHEELLGASAQWIYRHRTLKELRQLFGAMRSFIFFPVGDHFTQAEYDAANAIEAKVNHVGPLWAKTRALLARWQEDRRKFTRTIADAFTHVW